MNASFLILGSTAAAALLAGMPCANAEDASMQHGKASSGMVSTADDNALIQSAMTAAPSKVATGATVVVPEPDGKMRTLRQGNNGFTCMPDNPTTPGKDPMCMDKSAMEWAN